MRLGAFLVWITRLLAPNSMTNRDDFRSPGSHSNLGTGRLLMRQRRDGRTETVRVDEPQQRTVLLVIIAALTVVLLGLRSVSASVGVLAS